MNVCLSILHPLRPHLHLPRRGSHGPPPPPPSSVSRLVHPHDVVLCHWVFGRSQDHSGALMAEEFKACLISLGYDVENDKQVGAPGQQGQKRDGVCPASEWESRAEITARPVAHLYLIAPHTQQ